MNPSVSVCYPIDRAPARRDLTTGALVSLALLAGAFWYGQAAQRAYLPIRPAARTDQAVPSVPPIELIEVESNEAPPPPNTPPVNQVAVQPDLPPPPTANPFIQPPEPTRAVVNLDPHATIVPPNYAIQPGDPVYNPDTLDQVPVATFQPAPTYPYALKRAGVSGIVLVDFIVETNGTTSHVTVSGGLMEFGQNAKEAIAQWRFRPGRKLGRAVRTHMAVPVRFTLETQP